MDRKEKSRTQLAAGNSNPWVGFFAHVAHSRRPTQTMSKQQAPHAPFFRDTPKLVLGGVLSSKVSCPSNSVQTAAVAAVYVPGSLHFSTATDTTSLAQSVQQYCDEWLLSVARLCAEFYSLHSRRETADKFLWWYGFMSPPSSWSSLNGRAQYSARNVAVSNHVMIFFSRVLLCPVHLVRLLLTVVIEHVIARAQQN